MTTESSPPLSLEFGATVFYRGKPYVIRKESQDFTTVVICDPETGDIQDVAITDLSPTVPAAISPVKDLSDYDPATLAVAERKFEIIKPLLDTPGHSKQEVMERATATGVHFVTIYKWLRQFETTGKLSAFIRQDRKDKGDTQLPAAVEKIITDAIETLYLHKQKRRASKVIEAVRLACAKARLHGPHPNTVRNRIKKISAVKTMVAREGHKAARDAYAPQKGHFPGADFPLAVVQVDHTPVDIILVDDIFRQAIGRPWLTLLIDVFSRMVLGFYISFDPPGNLSLGLCLTHAFLPKESWLAKLGIETAWPCWGIPRTIHADNAKEFRAEMIQRACKEYGISMEWRPVATPHYGAHIERLLGTLNREIHTAPGSTFSNPGERGEYDSDAESAMSLAEFERWFTILCVEVYHQKKHSKLGMSPIAKWQEGILGTPTQLGIGVPARITDEQRLKLDLMPFELRTVQQYGIIWDHIEYQHDVLRRWINAPDPERPKLKRKFLCRRDPRDISTIWFYDPETQRYQAIPYRNTSHPAISIWELKEAERRVVEEQPEVPINERLIFSAYDKLRRIEEDAKKLTKKARRGNERRRLGLAKAQAHLDPKNSPTVIPAQPPPAICDIKPFDDVDDMQEDN